MIKSNTPIFSQLVQEFFCKYMKEQRDLSDRTVASYRDTFRLLLDYLRTTTGKQPVALQMNDLTASNIEAFLSHLEKNRKNSVRTRNNRFAAIRSFLQYAASRDPTSLSIGQSVLAIPMKRFDRPQLGYLSQEEMDAILDVPDATKWTGRRDRVMFRTLYNTGIRVSELIKIKVSDVSLSDGPFVAVHGKGRKTRSIPLWKSTARELRKWIKECASDERSPLFPNSTGAPLTRSGVEYRLRLAVSSAKKGAPSLKNRQVSPHTVRHTTAMHLLQSGVDITVIALWLGHESTATTHMYVEADLAMKERALEKLNEPDATSTRYRPTDKLLQFLENL